MSERHVIPARRGRAVLLGAGQTITVINTFGQQVVDTWAFRQGALSEFMSMEHTRAVLARTMPRQGDALYTNRRQPILRLIEDTSPGVHDTLIAACDCYRYELLGCKTYHDNCTDNLKTALAEVGMVPPETPCPLNLFMNIPVDGTGLSFEPPLTKPGDYVSLMAAIDCVVVLSACPQDIVPMNGTECRPTDVHYQIV